MTDSTTIDLDAVRPCLADQGLADDDAQQLLDIADDGIEFLSTMYDFERGRFRSLHKATARRDRKAASITKPIAIGLHKRAVGVATAIGCPPSVIMETFTRNARIATHGVDAAVEHIRERIATLVSYGIDEATARNALFSKSGPIALAPSAERFKSRLDDMVMWHQLGLFDRSSSLEKLILRGLPTTIVSDDLWQKIRRLIVVRTQATGRKPHVLPGGIREKVEGAITFYEDRIAKGGISTPRPYRPNGNGVTKVKGGKKDAQARCYWQLTETVDGEFLLSYRGGKMKNEVQLTQRTGEMLRFIVQHGALNASTRKARNFMPASSDAAVAFMAKTMMEKPSHLLAGSYPRPARPLLIGTYSSEKGMRLLEPELMLYKRETLEATG